ncbi:MAG: HpcH/HpaI aldolase family protein, partial [Armatimonadota bacterium]
MQENTVLKKLKEGKPTIGSWVTLDSPLAAGIMARTGLDWVVVDTEHGALGYKEMLAAIHAVLLTPAVPIVRTTWSDTALIKRALDAGAMGILVPMVMTPNEAEQAVEAVRFPPKGRRSIGGLAAQTLHGDDYFAAANEQILLAVQIEHKDAVELAEEICRVEGVDLVFVGPYDLAASMGLLNCRFKNHPSWQEAVQT